MPDPFHAVHVVQTRRTRWEASWTPEIARASQLLFICPPMAHDGVYRTGGRLSQDTGEETPGFGSKPRWGRCRGKFLNFWGGSPGFTKRKNCRPFPKKNLPALPVTQGWASPLIGPTAGGGESGGHFGLRASPLKFLRGLKRSPWLAKSASSFLVGSPRGDARNRGPASRCFASYPRVAAFFSQSRAFPAPTPRCSLVGFSREHTHDAHRAHDGRIPKLKHYLPEF